MLNMDSAPAPWIEAEKYWNASGISVNLGNGKYRMLVEYTRVQLTLEASRETWCDTFWETPLAFLSSWISALLSLT